VRPPYRGSHSAVGRPRPGPGPAGPADPLTWLVAGVAGLGLALGCAHRVAAWAGGGGTVLGRVLTGATLLVLAGTTGAGWRLWRRAWIGGRRPPGLSGPEAPAGRPAQAAWAGRRDLAPLLVDSPRPGRLVLGSWGRRLVATEARQSVLVVGPTQTLKTSGLAVPALLEWEGPVLATSVKTDLVRHTLTSRSQRGRVWVYDPVACTGLSGQGWSPLAGCGTWTGARRTAAAMVEASRSVGSGPSDADFWYATAAKLLAPLLFAAATSGRCMADVVAWVDGQEVEEVVYLLSEAGVDEALLAAEASFSREERARSSVFTTAETVLEPFADPVVAAGEQRAVIDPPALLDGGAHTLYLCAPAHEQRRLRPLFSALVDQVVRAVYEQASRRAAPLDPPLLMVLDEAASIAPLEDLDTLAATGAGQGIQLVTVWQDLAQVTARYGARAPSVVNNHRAKLLLSGVSDLGTLDPLSTLLGEEEVASSSVSRGPEGARSETESSTPRRLASPDSLRRIPPGHGLLIYGHLPPARLRLRPWFRDRGLLAMVPSAEGGGPSPAGRRSRWRG
jgi:type IV secretion system protein VirD4